MSSTAELKKVKLNITNIKSVLLDGKKAVDEKKKDREDFLTKLAEEKKQKKEEKGLEKPIKPTEKKPNLKSPVKSSAGLMNRIFTFVGAIVGGILVKALPEIIETFKKVYQAIKPFYATMIEFWTPIFKSIIKIFSGKDSYESEKEKVNTDIEDAQLAGKDIDDQVGELDKASDEVINENKGLGANAKALGVEEKDLLQDREEKDEDDKEEYTEEKEEDKKEESEITSNEGTTDAGLTPTITVDGSGESTSDSTTTTSESSDNTDVSSDDNFINKIEDAEFTGVKVLTAPVPPVRDDYPKTALGLSAYITAKKQYEIEYKEFKKTRENLIKPSDKNNNGLNALNTTDGLTSVNGTGSKTIVLQRQIVQTNTVIPV